MFFHQPSRLHDIKLSSKEITPFNTTSCFGVADIKDSPWQLWVAESFVYWNSSWLPIAKSKSQTQRKHSWYLIWYSLRIGWKFTFKSEQELFTYPFIQKLKVLLCGDVQASWPSLRCEVVREVFQKEMTFEQRSKGYVDRGYNMCKNPYGRKGVVTLRKWKKADKTGKPSMKGGQSRVTLELGAMGATERLLKRAVGEQCNGIRV